MGFINKEGTVDGIAMLIFIIYVVVSIFGLIYMYNVLSGDAKLFVGYVALAFAGVIFSFLVGSKLFASGDSRLLTGFFLLIQIILSMVILGITQKNRNNIPEENTNCKYSITTAFVLNIIAFVAGIPLIYYSITTAK